MPGCAPSAERMDFPQPVEEAVALGSLTTLGIGGPARYLARCGHARELVDTLASMDA